MFSSVGAFLYDLAGIRLAPGSSGWTTAWLWPVVTDHPSLGYASGSYDSIAGRFAVSWDATGATPCLADVPENVNVTLACAGAGNTITAITFASFGTPSGSCAAGFTKGSCDAANTTSAIAGLCVGKQSCVVPSDTGFFGDPCFNTVKKLDVLYTCAATPDLTLAATVPVAATATVVLPFAAATPPSAVTVTEAGVVVYTKGAFVPGVPGVSGAQLLADVPAIALSVGSGTYAFAIEA